MTFRSPSVTFPTLKAPLSVIQCTYKLFDYFLQEKVAQIQKKLAVNVTTLSSTIRKLTSAEDRRPSATGIGILGIVIITVTCGSVCLMDAATLFRDLKTLTENVKSAFR